MKKILLGICLALLTQQCDKEDDKKETSKTDKASNVADCQNAVLKFAPIQEAIDAPVSNISKGCASADCHVAGENEPFFVKGDAKKNRNKLAGYEGNYWKVGDRLYQKITASHTLHSEYPGKTEEGHGGGDQSAILGSEAVTNWTTAEAGCK